MVLTAETVEIIRKGVESREALNDPERIRGIHRITLEVQEDCDTAPRGPARRASP